MTNDDVKSIIMSNIYLKVNREKNWRSQDFDFLSLKNCSHLRTHHWILEILVVNLKIRGLGAKLCVAFLLFNFERNYDVLKSKSLCIFLNKNMNLDIK